jgi:anti-sigma regulatory factor (Ser/Thr protein kinase)
VVTLFQPSLKEHWGNLSFVSTLYLCPVLDCLIEKVPKRWQAETRLGLQEALVNAVKHGNHHDPHKVIAVHYKTSGNQYWWVIEDEGAGFDVSNCCNSTKAKAEDVVSDCGRGVFILNQVFDDVQWTRGGRQLHLYKRVGRWFNVPQVG